MGNRGRTSAAALTVISSGGVTSLRRPDPPTDLTDEQVVVWRTVVNRMPADWFPAETHEMLAHYCRHVIAARRVAQLVANAEAAEDFHIWSYDKLLKMQEREGRAIGALATRMRLTQQTTYDKSKKKPIKGPFPWDEP